MDVFGKALIDFYKAGETEEPLILHNSYGNPEEMPLDYFFRAEEDMPELELLALQECRGKVLDVGAGVGGHALALQSLNKDITAIDISAAAVDIMKSRGVKKAFVQDIFQYQAKFDTILMLMNGIGLTGTLAGFKDFLQSVKSLLHTSGQLIFDSSDISYLYEGLQKPQNQYYGEVSYQYEYKGEKGNWFNWVYVDESTIKTLAEDTGWNCEILFNDDEDQFLVKLTLQS